ncbi:MAG: ABC transporter permease [Chloroflexota bacterium]
MTKFWLVFKHEYLRHVKRRRFIFGLLSIPLFMAVIMGVSMFAASLTVDRRPVGYIDLSTLFANAQPLPENRAGLFSNNVKILSFPDETSARDALDNGDIQAYYVIQGDYLTSGSVRVVSEESVDSEVNQRFSRFLLTNLMRSEDAAVRQRILNGPTMIMRTLDGDQKLDGNNPFAFLVVIFSGVIFMLAINTSGGYLLQAVVEEKENRTIEILLTSLSPDQFMAGKIFGNLSVGLTQLIFWLIMAGAGMLIATRTFPDLAGMGFNVSFFILMAATFLPAFIMIAALMTMVGATATEAREAQQVAGLFTLPIVVPFWFLPAIMETPNGALAIGLSLFPFSAPLTLPLRSMVTNLPAWQIALSLGLLVLAAAGAIWLASRAFRLGMLRYGKKLSLAEILRARS